MNDEQDFWPTANWDSIRLRARLLNQLRNFFTLRGFLEVDTPLISSDSVVDRYIDPIPIEMEQSKWLQTSPEFHMKRLLAAGGEALFQVTKAFRNEEQGTLHNVEFSIVEWYRIHQTMSQGMDLLDELSCELLQRGTAERLSYGEVFQKRLGLDPHTAATDELIQAATIHCPGVQSLDRFDRDSLLNLLLAECVQPHLGCQRPTILFDWPASQAALARIRRDDPPVAERFELYVEGVELANGYHELVDPDELRQRIRIANEQRAADKRGRLPESNRLLGAMEHGLPPCTGVALGFDRLVMIAAEARSIRQVIAFPFDRA